MIRFAAVGVFATALHYVIYYLLLGVMSHNMAFTIGYVVSFTSNYVLSSLFTFKVPMSLQKLLGFGLSHLTNYLIQITLLNIVLLFGVSEPLAPLPVYVIAVPINFLLVRFVLKRRNTENDAYLLTLIIIGIAIAGLNFLDAPTLGDDMLYRFMWNADESAPVRTIESLSGLIHSQVVHYQVVNGRFFVHTLAQAFLAFLPPVVLQIINSLLFVLLVFQASKLCLVSSLGTSLGADLGADASKRQTPSITAFLGANLGADASQRQNPLFLPLLFCFFLFIVMQGFRTTMLWSLGTFNYLWVLVMALALFLWMHKIKDRPLSLSDLLLSPFALFVGCGHEALSLPVSVAFAVYIFERFFRHKDVSIRLSRHKDVSVPTYHKKISALLPYMLWFMVGTLLCLLSPGILGRSADALTLKARLLSGAMNYVFNIRVLWLLIITLLILWRKDREALKRHFSTFRYVYLALLVSLAIVTLCGTNLERVAFYTDFLSLLLLLVLLNQHLGTTWKHRLVLLCSIVMILFYIPVYLVRQENSDIWHKAELQMKEPGRELIAIDTPTTQKNGSSQFLTFNSPLFTFFRDHYVNPSFTFGFFSSYMVFDANDINLRCAARLYDKQKMVMLPSDVVQRIEADSTAYSHYELDNSGALYIWRLDDNTQVGADASLCRDSIVTGVTFILNNEDPSTLLPHQRLVAYQGNEYELDDFHFEQLTLFGRQYLVFTRPTTNIYRRIKDIQLSYDNKNL